MQEENTHTQKMKNEKDEKIEGEKDTATLSAENTDDNDDKITIEERLALAEDKISALQDKYLRQVAEFDNYRKRTMKEKAELILNGGEKTITALLPVLDDMERALKNMNDTIDIDTLKEGIELIFQKMNKILGTEGLKKIDTENADFNTDFHEAIALVPSPTEDEKGKILDCVQTGYMLNNKVIRHAKVAVGE